MTEHIPNYRDTNAIRNLALAEIEKEDRLRAIEQEKLRIRARRARPWFQRLFPWRIIFRIERTDP